MKPRRGAPSFLRSNKRKSGRDHPLIETYSLSQAKASLGRLILKVEKGATVYIIRGQKRFVLQAVPELEPIPTRPPGYFQFDQEDIALDKKLSAVNVIPALESE